MRNEFNKLVNKNQKLLIYKESYLKRMRKPIFNSYKKYRDVFISLNEYFVESVATKSIKNYLT